MPFLDEPAATHYGAADAAILALRLRMLAAVLGALAGADGDSDERFADRPADWSPRPDDAPHLPVLLVVRLPAHCRRSDASRPTTKTSNP